ncbi:MAG: L-fuculose-phosphate aldolase [Solirubrobacteraceae bacterium]|jgi:L-fuculose-phosphate aldolase|nr:L-fuculose-phosphate aldolase [Solirubrobacteraceae bacterium]
MSAPRHAAQREALAAACRRLAAAGLTPGTTGNASVRVGDELVISPTGSVLGELQAADAVVIDLDGRVLDGEGEPTSELAMHRALYALGDEVGAIVHTHAPYATALSCVVDEVPAIHYGMLAVGGSVRVAPYALFGSRELADGVEAALRGRRAALMSNHGAVAYAADPAAAAEVMVELEWACTLYWRAAALGAPRALDEAALGAVADEMRRRGYPGA